MSFVIHSWSLRPSHTFDDSPLPHPRSFAFDKTHVPHISLLHMFTGGTFVSYIANTLCERLADFARLSPEERTISTGALYDGTADVAGTQYCGLDVTGAAVKALHLMVVESVGLFRYNVFMPAEDGSLDEEQRANAEKVFYMEPGDPGITARTMLYVHNFQTDSSGDKFHPHISIGAAPVRPV